MKKLQMIYVTAFMLIAAPGHTASFDNSSLAEATPSLMLYSAIPLDGNPQQKTAAMRFGFRMDYTRPLSSTMDRSDEPGNTGRPAFFDFSINGNHLPTMKINGISALTYQLSSNVAGGGVIATGVNWTYVAYGVAATAVAKKAYDNRHDDPPQETPAPAPVRVSCCGFTLNISCVCK